MSQARFSSHWVSKIQKAEISRSRRPNQGQILALRSTWEQSLTHTWGTKPRSADARGLDTTTIRLIRQVTTSWASRTRDIATAMNKSWLPGQQQICFKSLPNAPPITSAKVLPKRSLETCPRTTPRTCPRKYPQIPPKILPKIAWNNAWISRQMFTNVFWHWCLLVCSGWKDAKKMSPKLSYLLSPKASRKS